MHLETLAGKPDKRLFYKMCNQAHCLHSVLPPLASGSSVLTRPKGHLYELRRHKYDITKKFCPTVFVQFSMICNYFVHFFLF